MIIKGASRQNDRFFARHLVNTKDNTRVRLVEFRGFASENIGNAFREMKADAAGTRCENYFYHADLSPREFEDLDDAQWEEAADILERQLGLENQNRFVVEHEKNGRVHRHIVWSRIDTDTGKAISDSLTYKKHEAAAREIERAFGLQPVQSVLVKDREGPRPERRAKDWEGLRGSQTKFSPDQVKLEVTELWNECDSGKAFAAALTEHGYTLCKGDKRHFCLVDPAGNEHSLARRIAGAKAADVRARLVDIDRDSLPSVAGARTLNREERTPAAQEKREDRAFERFMAPAVASVKETGETPLHGMEGVAGSWWERWQGVIARGRDKAAGWWQATKARWQDFIKNEKNGREYEPER